MRKTLAAAAASLFLAGAAFSQQPAKPAAKAATADSAHAKAGAHKRGAHAGKMKHAADSSKHPTKG